MSALLAMCFSIGAFAQNIVVKGVVTDESGLPAIGAAVFEKGNDSNGVVTGLDGDYTITVPSNAVLLISSVHCRECKTGS